MNFHTFRLLNKEWQRFTYSAISYKSTTSGKWYSRWAQELKIFTRTIKTDQIIWHHLEIELWSFFISSELDFKILEEMKKMFLSY